MGTVSALPQELVSAVFLVFTLGVFTNQWKATKQNKYCSWIGCLQMFQICCIFFWIFQMDALKKNNVQTGKFSANNSKLHSKEKCTNTLFFPMVSSSFSSLYPSFLYLTFHFSLNPSSPPRTQSNQNLDVVLLTPTTTAASPLHSWMHNVFAAGYSSWLNPPGYSHFGQFEFEKLLYIFFPSESYSCLSKHYVLSL